MPSHFLNKCRFNVNLVYFYILESESVYSRYVVGLSSVSVRGCRSAVGYDSIIVLMIGFQSASYRLSIGLKSGDYIPNPTWNDPDMNPVADSWPIHWKFYGFVDFRVGLAGVTGVLHGTTLIPARVSNYIPSKVWVEITYHSQISTVPPMKLGNVLVISSHTS